MDMENSNSGNQIKSGSFRKGSFRKDSFRLGGKDHTVVELGSIDTQKLLLEGGGGEIREKQKTLTNSLSVRQMKTLTALSDTILPSINDFVPVSDDDESAATFYRISASMAGTPERLGGIISERLIHPMTMVLKLVLWFLSTWLGTIILCGMGCLSTKFPFIHTFPDLPLHKRQQIMQSWSLSFFRHLRMLFRTIKLLTLLIFFTQTKRRQPPLSSSSAKSSEEKKSRQDDLNDGQIIAQVFSKNR